MSRESRKEARREKDEARVALDARSKERWSISWPTSFEIITVYTWALSVFMWLAVAGHLIYGLTMPWGIGLATSLALLALLHEARKQRKNVIRMGTVLAIVGRQPSAGGRAETPQRWNNISVIITDDQVYISS